MKRIAFALSLALLSPMAVATPGLGETLPAVTLDGKDGGRVDGSAWSSAELTDKVHVLFYVDPDERSLNDHVAEAIKRAELDRSRYGSLAIINLEATWLPNAILEGSLEDKQKEFPYTLYVKDKRKVLVKRWGLADHNSDILALDPQGRVIFYRSGKLSEEQTAELIQLIKDNLPR